MKALTVTQPYASALAYGLKEYEVRPRKSNHRGLTVIHAGKMLDQTALTECTGLSWNEHIQRPLLRRYAPLDAHDFRLGCLVAVAELTDCIEINDELMESVPLTETISGNWELGNFAYKFTNVQLLTTPLPATGKQGFWPISDDDEKTIRAQIA